MTKNEITEADMERMMTRFAQIAASEEQVVDRLGQQIGYGRLMQAASKMWAEKCDREGMPRSNHTTGPCEALTVPCFCRRVPPGDPNHHAREGGCDWCCGCGWLTKAVANMIEHG